MKVAMLSPVWFSVPPVAYGGIESVVHLQVEGLVRAGVDVTLFASGDSTTSAELVSVFDTAPSERIGQTFWEFDHAVTCLRSMDEFDVVHDHTGLLGLALFGLAEIPARSHRSRPAHRRSRAPVPHGLPGRPRRRPRLACRGISGVRLPELPWVANVPNAIDISRYDVERVPGDGIAFLGRMSPDKGVHTAIEVARATGRPLRIAAKCREEGELEYFRTVIEPELSAEIEYVGELDHTDKVELLRTSHCLLFPIEWEEPFGLVMIEAMACGTPVVATRRGSVPEVVSHGRTGLIVERPSELPRAVELVGALDQRRDPRGGREPVLRGAHGRGLPPRLPDDGRAAGSGRRDRARRLRSLYAPRGA